MLNTLDQNVLKIYFYIEQVGKLFETSIRYLSLTCIILIYRLGIGLLKISAQKNKYQVRYSTITNAVEIRKLVK